MTQEGFRLDTEGKPEKVKAMGLDLNRGYPLCKILDDLLHDVLTGSGREEIIEKIKEFKINERSRGRHTRVNNPTKYSAKKTL